jgi:hypothetical protein
MGEPSIMRQLEIALASSGGSERLFRVHCRPIVAKIESDAKVIAALRGAFLVHLMRENECYCFQNGVPCDAKKCGCLIEMEAAISEQTAGKTK